MDDMDEYMRCLDIIAETNHIQPIEPIPPKIENNEKEDDKENQKEVQKEGEASQI